MYYIFISGLDSIINRAPENKKIINFLQGSPNVIINKSVTSVYLNDLNLENILEYLYNNNYKVKQSFSFTEKYLILSEQINEYFNVSNNGSKIIELFCNKFKMRKFLKENNSSLNTIDYYHIKGSEIMEFNFKNNNYIIKPIFGTGSNNVSFINSKNKLEVTKKYKDDDNLIIESFIEGEEYSIEAITFNNKHNILGITKKEINPNFVEMSHEFPAPLDSYKEELFKIAVISFLDTIGYKQGLSHTEVKVLNNKVYIIESQPRTGGDRIVSLVRIVNGIDMISYYLHLCMGEKNYAMQLKTYKKAVSFFPNLNKVGRVTRIPNSNFVNKYSDEAEVIIKVGDLVEEPLNSSLRHSMIVTYGNSFVECKNIKDLFVKSILDKIEVE